MFHILKDVTRRGLRFSKLYICYLLGMCIDHEMQRQAIKRYILWQKFTSVVRLSVCLSRSCIVPKRLNLSSTFFNHLKAQSY